MCSVVNYFFLQHGSCCGIFLCNIDCVAGSSPWSVCSKGLVAEPLSEIMDQLQNVDTEGLAPDHLIKSPSNGPGSSGRFTKARSVKGNHLPKNVSIVYENV